MQYEFLEFEPVSTLRNSSPGHLSSRIGCSEVEGSCVTYTPLSEIRNSAYYTISSKLIGKFLDVSGASGGDGTAVIQWTGWGGDNQKFRLDDAGDGCYRIIAKRSGKCLDITGASTDDGAPVIQWPDRVGDNQKWRFTETQ